ncbi:MAG: hypothetical protein AAF081_11945 [Actinomycetota bacterium]
MQPRVVALALAGLSLLATGCGDDDEFVDEPSTADESADDLCTVDVLGEEDGLVTSIYALDDGRLAGLCFGDPDEAVTGAFELLESVTRPDQLRDVAYVGGFEAQNSTLAFVTPLDDDYSAFVMAIDTIAAVDDPGELRLTVLHEFAHVITQRNDQLDLDTPPAACPTYWNGVGCFIPGSYVDAWVQEFWSREELLSLPTDGVDELAGERRCAVDASFLGAYAASDPEEDFAESYSAFIFDLDVPAPVEPRMAFFEEFPELRESRDLARESNVGEVPNNFDRCG